MWPRPATLALVLACAAARTGAAPPSPPPPRPAVFVDFAAARAYASRPAGGALTVNSTVTDLPAYKTARFDVLVEVRPTTIVTITPQLLPEDLAEPALAITNWVLAWPSVVAPMRAALDALFEESYGGWAYGDDLQMADGYHFFVALGEVIAQNASARDAVRILNHTNATNLTEADTPPGGQNLSVFVFSLERSFGIETFVLAADAARRQRRLATEGAARVPRALQEEPEPVENVAQEEEEEVAEVEVVAAPSEPVRLQLREAFIDGAWPPEGGTSLGAVLSAVSAGVAATAVAIGAVAAGSGGGAAPAAGVAGGAGGAGGGSLLAAALLLAQLQFMHTLSFAPVLLPPGYKVFLHAFRWANLFWLGGPRSALGCQATPPSGPERARFAGVWAVLDDAGSSPQSYWSQHTATLLLALGLSAAVSLAVHAYWARRLKQPLPPFLQPPRLQLLVGFTAFHGTVLSQCVLWVTAHAGDGCGAGGYLAGASLIFLLGPCALVAWLAWALHAIVARGGAVGWREHDMRALARLSLEWRRARERRLGGKGVAGAPAGAPASAAAAGAGAPPAGARGDAAAAPAAAERSSGGRAARLLASLSAWLERVLASWEVVTSAGEWQPAGEAAAHDLAAGRNDDERAQPPASALARVLHRATTTLGAAAGAARRRSGARSGEMRADTDVAACESPPDVATSADRPEAAAGAESATVTAPSAGPPPPSPPPEPATGARAPSPTRADDGAACGMRAPVEPAGAACGAGGERRASRARALAERARAIGRAASHRLSGAAGGAPAAARDEANDARRGVELIGRLGLIFEARRGPATLHLPLEMARVALRCVLLVCVPATLSGLSGGLVIVLELADAAVVVVWRPFVERQQNATRTALALARALHVTVLFCGGWSGAPPAGIAAALVVLQLLTLLLALGAAASAAAHDLAQLRADSVALIRRAAEAVDAPGAAAGGGVAGALPRPLFAKLLARAVGVLASTMPKSERALRARALDAYAAEFARTERGSDAGGDGGARDDAPRELVLEEGGGGGARAHAPPLTHPREARRALERQARARALARALLEAAGRPTDGTTPDADAQLFGGDALARARAHERACAALQATVREVCATEWQLPLQGALADGGAPPTSAASAELLAGALRALLDEEGAGAVRLAAELGGLGERATESFVAAAAPALRAVFEPRLVRNGARMLNAIVPPEHAIPAPPDDSATAGGALQRLRARLRATVSPHAAAGDCERATAAEERRRTGDVEAARVKG